MGKLFDVNPHSMYNLNEKQNGKRESEIIDILKKLFSQMDPKVILKLIGEA